MECFAKPRGFVQSDSSPGHPADGPKWPDSSRIAEAFDVSVDTVARPRYRCVFEGLAFDEASQQLVDRVTRPVEATPEHPNRIIDYEYTRNGTANIFLLYAPWEGRREALVTDRRTTLDYTHAIRHLVEVM